MNLEDAESYCPRCGRTVVIGEIDFSGEFINCLDCEDKVLLSSLDIRQVLQRVEGKASNHGSNYSAGMRLARHLIEEELLEEVKSDDPRE